MRDLVGCIYYVLVWPMQCVARAAADDLLVRAGLKRTVSTGRPVWRR